MPYISQCFENAFRYHTDFFDYQSNEKITVFMQDFWDYGNAGATAIPENYIRIGIAPLNYVYESSPANERINHTMNHEIVHIVASDKASGSDNFYRKIFGGKVGVTPDDPLSMFYSYLTNPRRYSPRWYHEGIAVYMETWMAGGIGRAMGSYDEMVFRAMVRDKSYIYDVVGLESEGTAIDFQVGVNSYLYGTRFMSYVSNKYSPEKLIEWISGTKNRKKYFSSQFKNVFGSSLDDEWANWIKWEQKFQQANLDSIRLFPTTKYWAVSKSALGSVSRGHYDKVNNKLYVAMLLPAKTPQIASIDLEDGSIQKICNVYGAGLFYVTSLTYDPEAQKIFFASDNGAWRDLNSVEIKTGETKRLITDVRTGDLAFNKQDKSIWGIRHYNGISTIVRIPYPYKEWDQIYSWPYGRDMYDLDISPDGKILIGSLAEISGQQLLIKMQIDSLLQSNNSFDIIFDFENSVPANFTFSEDGRYIFGSSYYSGVSNIYRYDLETEDIDAISNCETGFFRPIPISEDSLIVFRYTGKGFVPVIIPNEKFEFISAVNFLGNEIVKNHPVVIEWQAGSPADINLQSITTFTGPYSSFKSINLLSVYPIVQGYKNHASVGLRTDFSDKLGVTRFDASASYTPNTRLPENERFHAGINFHHWNWQIKASYNRADFYDLFGPTKTSRKGHALGLQYDRILFAEKPKSLEFNFNISGYTGQDRLPFFQNVTSPVEEFMTFGASLYYSYLLKTLGSVDYEKGWDLELLTYNYYANNEVFPHGLVNFNAGILLPIPHSSLWFRSSFGVSSGERDVAFANFYFGGFGNNWIDHQNVQRYREFYSFPGMELNDVEAQNYTKLMLEWNLPPLRFRRFGFTNLYLNWTRLSLFASGIMEDLHKKEYRSSIANIGAQLDFKLVIFTYMSSTFSLGYAAAFPENQKISTEFMISLKIL
jgi:hypothetical protein